MIITNLTANEYWFGPMHLPAGSGQTLYLDDTSDTSLYLLNDEVADAVNTLYLSASVAVTSNAQSFPRATGTPALLHGDGSPEGMVYGPQGSLYLRRDTVQASTSLYSKQTGVTQNTGWVSVIAAAGDLIPSAALSREGCLLCDGTSYARASYPVLFAAIGTSYGSVDGAHFNVPDLRGRLPLGAGTGTGSGATAWTLGSQPTSGAGGEQAHLLTGVESGLQQHAHGVSDPGHAHMPNSSGATGFVAGGTTGFSEANVTTGGGGYVLTDTDERQTGVTVDNAGPNDAASAHNILPPVSVINWFIVHG